MGDAGVLVMRLHVSQHVYFFLAFLAAGSAFLSLALALVLGAAGALAASFFSSLSPVI